MEEDQSAVGESLDKPEVAEDEAKKAEVNTDKPKKPGKNKKLQAILGRFNIYLLIFILLVVVVGAYTYASYLKQRREDAAPTTPTQELDAEALKQLQNSDTTVGDPRQTLTVQSNSIFNGQVLVRDSLDIAGSLRVGNTLNLTGLIVSGSSSLDQIQGNSLSVDGDANIQGQLTIQKGLTVSGGGTFGGAISAPTLSVDSLQLSGDLQFNKHIDAGGPTPTSTNGSALGSGGTAGVSGTDTSGTLNINIGNNPLPGCFVALSFSRGFNGQPHIVISPIGGSAASLDYYVTRIGRTGFSVCTANAATAGSSFEFDYVVID
jgi:cytoskeletal protein CcmA (bactofilin family)